MIKPPGDTLTPSQKPSSDPHTTSSFVINVVSSKKGKYQQQPGSRKKGKGKKRKCSSL